MQIQTDEHLKEQKFHGSYDFPLLISRERITAYESDSFLWHWHPEIEITVVTSGEMLYHVNNCHLHLKNCLLYTSVMKCSYQFKSHFFMKIITVFSQMWIFLTWKCDAGIHI